MEKIIVNISHADYNSKEALFDILEKYKFRYEIVKD